MGVVRAAAGRQRQVGMAALPGLQAGVDVEHAVLLAPFDQRDAGHIERNVDQKIARAELALEDGNIVRARQRLDPEFDPVFGGNVLAEVIGGDDGDLPRAQVDMAQDQRQRALSHGTETDHQHLAWEGGVLFVRAQLYLSHVAATKLPERLYPKAAAIAIRRAARRLFGISKRRSSPLALHPKLPAPRSRAECKQARGSMRGESPHVETARAAVRVAGALGRCAG